MLTGTYCSLNRGDATMQLVCAEGLASRLPGAHLIVHTPFPEVDRDFYSRRGVPVVRSSRRRLILGTYRLARLMAAPLGRHGWDADASASLPPCELAAIAGADAIVDLSGDMLTEDYGIHVAYSHYLPLLQALAAQVPLLVCAQTVGPFRWTKPLARRIFNGAQLVTLRETRSLNHVQSLGARPKHLEVTADLAFALRPAPAEEVDGALEAAGAPGHQRWIGVSASGLAESYRRRTGRRRTRLIDELAPALREVGEAADARILLVPHVYGPRPEQDDREVLAELRALLSGRAVLLERRLEPEVLKGIIGRCSLFVGARMHAVMGALSTAVPVLALAYSHKAQGIMEDFEMGDWVLDAATAERADLRDRLMALLNAREAVTADLRARAEGARRSAERNLDLIAGIVMAEEAA